MAVEASGASELPVEVERRFAGKWIAMRDETVVAVADDYDGLVSSDGVRPEDDVYCVGPGL